MERGGTGRRVPLLESLREVGRDEGRGGGGEGGEDWVDSYGSWMRVLLESR
jgi:hypothetical protein